MALKQSRLQWGMLDKCVHHTDTDHCVWLTHDANTTNIVTLACVCVETPVSWALCNNRATVGFVSFISSIKTLAWLDLVRLTTSLVKNANTKI